MSPLVEDLVCFGMAALPTAEQGDCGLDVMVYWDGQDRSTASWKTLCLELGAAIDGVAADPHWHGVLDACAELPLPERTSADAAGTLAVSLAALAASPQKCSGSRPDEAEMAAVVAYFCGSSRASSSLDAGVMALALSDAERADIVEGFRALTAETPKEDALVVSAPCAHAAASAQPQYPCAELARKRFYSGAMSGPSTCSKSLYLTAA